jgi:uncharacterized Zn finger protein
VNAEAPLRIDLLARSSSGDEPYHVSIQFQDNKVTATCDCQAGQHGLHCKHRMAVIAGDKTVLYDATQYPDLSRASDLLSRSRIKGVLDDVHAAEEAVEAAKREFKRQKARLGRLMNEGAAIDQG